jgi:hypothetical protein
MNEHPDSPLQFTSQYSGGNGCHLKTEKGKDGLWEVHFLPEPHGGTEVLWFRFQLEAQGLQRVRLCLRCAANLLGGSGPDSFVPVWKRENQWERMGRGGVRYEEDGQPVAWWEFDLSGKAEIAFCFPYGPDELEQTMAELAGAGTPWHRDLLGLTQKNRLYHRIANRYGNPEEPQPGVYLLARQHSGETPGSWVLDGLMRCLAAAGSQAPLAWIIPMVHLDGVVDGDYGKDPFPRNLNRSWGPVGLRHENHIVQHDLRRWKQRTNQRLLLDFHSPGGQERDGVYTFVPKVTSRLDLMPELMQWMAAVESKLAGHAASPFVRAANYPGRFGDGLNVTTYAMEHQGIPAVTLEIPYGAIGERVLGVADYRHIGHLLGEVLIGRFSQQNA